MATNQKIETQFRAALNATPEEREKSDDLSTGFNQEQDTWEVIVKHTGNLSVLADTYPEITIIELLNNYGILRLPAPLIDQVASEDIITYMEKPKRLFFEVMEGKRAACITSLQAREPTLTGRGTLVGVIDSGIDYAHPDFCNPDGSTRILALWDQTIPATQGSEAQSSSNEASTSSNQETFFDSSGEASTSSNTGTTIIRNNENRTAPPENYPLGTLYSRETINRALEATDPEIRYSICPSQDLSGHGTHVNSSKNKN